MGSTSESTGSRKTRFQLMNTDDLPPSKRRRVGLLYDKRMCKHFDSEKHVEDPNRIISIWKKLESSGINQRCVALNAKDAVDSHIALVHGEKHIDFIKNISSPSYDVVGRTKAADAFDSVYFNEGTSEAAWLSAGSVVEVVEKVSIGEIDSGFAIVRPPGHHAEANKPKGFCMLNNVAIASSYIINKRKELGISKILIVDWDIHHGNGTQKMFWKDPRVLVFSVHRYEKGSFYPFGSDGSYQKIGQGPGAGYNINVPWENGGCGDADYVAAWDHVLIPVAKAFDPDLIIISAGFDAAINDPLGGCCVTPYGFSIMLSKLMVMAQGRIVMALEGGYDLESLANSSLACVETLLNEKPVIGSVSGSPLESTWRVIQAVRKKLSTFWPILANPMPVTTTPMQVTTGTAVITPMPATTGAATAVIANVMPTTIPTPVTTGATTTSISTGAVAPMSAGAATLMPVAANAETLSHANVMPMTTTPMPVTTGAATTSMATGAVTPMSAGAATPFNCDSTYSPQFFREIFDVVSADVLHDRMRSLLGGLGMALGVNGNKELLEQVKELKSSVETLSSEKKQLESSIETIKGDLSSTKNTLTEVKKDMYAAKDEVRVMKSLMIPNMEAFLNRFLKSQALEDMVVKVLPCSGAMKVNRVIQNLRGQLPEKYHDTLEKYFCPEASSELNKLWLELIKDGQIQLPLLDCLRETSCHITPSVIAAITDGEGETWKGRLEGVEVVPESPQEDDAPASVARNLKKKTAKKLML